jgi:hypothetical protein
MRIKKKQMVSINPSIPCSSGRSVFFWTGDILNIQEGHDIKGKQ